MAGEQKEFVDYYVLLGLSPSATETDIRRAYLQLAKTLHPDMDGGDARQMQQLNAAYLTLKHDEKRRVYDLMHQAETGVAKIFYRYGDDSEHDELISNMSDEEVDDFINSVYTDFRATTPTKKPLNSLTSKMKFKKR